jgi:hypothetical protein
VKERAGPVDERRSGLVEYRAQFDAVVTFANGGGLRAEGFRVDVPRCPYNSGPV